MSTQTPPRIDSYAGQYLREYETRRYTPEDHLPLLTPQIIIPPGAEDFADVSFWQDQMNWDIYRQNCRLAIPRISQGNWRDVQWDRNYAEGKRVGCLLGGYHFVDDRYHPDEQTETLLAAVAGRTLELEIFLDWEAVFGGPYYGLSNVLKIHRNLVNAGVRCFDAGIYSGYYFVLEHSNAIDNAADYQYIQSENVPLWLAWYASSSVVRIPPPWTTWTHWQKGTFVKKWGQASEEIDVDVPNGTPEQITQKYGAPQPPDGGNMEITHKGTLVISGLASRVGPGTAYAYSNPPGGVLQKNDQVFGQWDGTNTGWFHYAKIIRVDGTEETWDAWASAIRGDTSTPPYIKVEPYTPPATGEISATFILKNDGTINGTWTES